MEISNSLKLTSYVGSKILITTKHNKAIALREAFAELLGANIVECAIDTDKLGTFTGEVDRKDSELVTAKIKCQQGLDALNYEYGIASEGSFGTYLYLPYNKETLYFIDRRRKFNLHISKKFYNTNYSMRDIANLDELYAFAKQAKFPSHALIVRPSPRGKHGKIFKGISNLNSLEDAYYQVNKQSRVYVETDMRANMNPTRMNNIKQVAISLAMRLQQLCPKCKTPGWGIIEHKTGLPCEVCSAPTEQLKMDILGCTKCVYKEEIIKYETASAANCMYCNP